MVVSRFSTGKKCYLFHTSPTGIDILWVVPCFTRWGHRALYDLDSGLGFVQMTIAIIEHD